MLEKNNCKPFCFSESGSERSAGGGGPLRVLLVVNCDLEAGRVDSELRVALQWIAASELGLPALHFRKSKDKSAAKVGSPVASKTSNQSLINPLQIMFRMMRFP